MLDRIAERVADVLEDRFAAAADLADDDDEKDKGDRDRRRDDRDDDRRDDDDRGHRPRGRGFFDDLRRATR